MRNRIECPTSAALAVLLALLACPAPAETAPSVTGTLQVAQRHGTAALAKATVELVSAANEAVKRRAYTDSDGRYVFRDVPAGIYVLRVKLGKELLYQKTGKGFVEEQRLRVGAKSLRMPAVLVRAGGG